MRESSSRRRFLGVAGTAAAAASLPIPARASGEADAPAILGGKPVRQTGFPSWPIIDETDERAWIGVLRSKKWGRLVGKEVDRFEASWAKTLGAKHAVAVANGTSALVTALAALDVGPGDEVIVPPYTFVATINAVLMHHALPIFVDTDRETFQIDAAKVAAALTENTRCVIPVHLGGSAADLDTIQAAAAPRSIPILEDACQAHLAEWKGKKVGTLGAMGCFSFQATKNLNSGEGGAIVTSDQALYSRARSFQNNGRTTSGLFAYERPGSNLRLTEFQGALLSRQLTRLEPQSLTREQNAQYLTQLLAEIPGITPAKMYPGCTRNAYHLYMFRYDPAGFSGLPRDRFLKALAAEGIPASHGYDPLYREPFLRNTLESRGYRAIYSPARLKSVLDQIHCPENDRLCAEAVWLTQTMLLGPRDDMDQIASAVRKIQKHAARLANA